MKGAIQQLLQRLKLSDTGTVHFFINKNDWKSIVSADIVKKLEQIKPTAFYVFNELPYILFFDLTGSLYNSELEAEIHKKVWSFDQAPVIFILKDSDIEIYNAFSYEKKKKKLQEIKLTKNEVDEMFSFWNLQSGQVWDWMKEKYYKTSIKQKRVSQKLFDNIKTVREKLTTGNSLIDDEANTLILRLIFVRYLIDRNVKLPADFIKGLGINERRLSFVELIAKPKLLNLFFAELNEKFNGVLFRDTEFELSDTQATALSEVFNGETAEIGSLFHGSDFFFEIFDFSIIPVELISGIYESLIDPDTRKLHSAVYTPSFLVEYMLTETVDIFFSKQEDLVTECRIFDPSVGSGIFLVQAYRRMVEREIEKLEDHKISKVRLREIAVNNLFGIDINEQALKVTCFSIYIAMLDYIDPASILISFKFPDFIGSNLFKANFFDTAHEYNKVILSKKINFLLGNPPWKSDKNDDHVKWLKANNKKIGRYEIAQSFLLRSKDFMTSNNVSALIVTSTIFYNVSNPTKQFKEELLTTFCIESFFDLSPVRRLIFEEKNNPCAVIFYRLATDKDYLSNVVKHQSVKSNIFLKYFKTLVIEKFDQKRIPQRHFLENDWMFKVALYGNSLDFAFLKKIETNKTKIIDLVDDKTIFKGAGIERGKDGRYYPDLEGLPIMENRNVTPYYSYAEGNNVLKKEDTFLSRGRRIEIFKGARILFKEQNEEESVPLMSFIEHHCVFRKGISAIASETKTQVLKSVFAYTLSDLYTYFLFIKSCSWGVSTRPQTRFVEEYLSFPLAEADEEVKTRLIDLINAFLTPFQEHYKEFTLGYPQVDHTILTKINSIMEQLYQIETHEIDLIDYVLNVSRYQFQENKQHKIIKKITSTDNTLNEYMNVFIREFSGIYDDEFLKVDIYILDYFIAINFVFEDEEPTEQINFVNEVTTESAIFGLLSKSLTTYEKTKDLFIQKDIKGFEESSFYIIKPNEYKCWHRAIAWYDMAEIKNAIESAEIDHLKQQWDAS